MNRFYSVCVCLGLAVTGCTNSEPDDSPAPLPATSVNQPTDELEQSIPPPAQASVQPAESSASPFETSSRPSGSVDLTTDSNYATPEDALRAFYKAIDASDMKTAEEASISLTPGYQEAFLKGMMAQPGAIKRFNEAVQKAFGEDTKLLPSTGKKFLAKIETIPVQYANLKSVIWKHSPGEQLTVIKLDNGWVVDLRVMERGNSDKSTFEAMGKLADFLVATAERVEKGELKSPDEIRSEFKKYKRPQ